MASELKTTLGLPPGLTVLYGRAGVGKTRTLVDIARAFHDEGVPVTFISTEGNMGTFTHRFPDLMPKYSANFQFEYAGDRRDVDLLIQRATAGSAVLVDGCDTLPLAEEFDGLAVFRSWLNQMSQGTVSKPLYIVATYQTPRNGRALRLPYPVIEVKG